MDERDARVLRLSRARREDSDDRRHRVLAIVDGLAADSRPLPIAELARRANVHRSFLYRHPDLYELAVATPLRKELAELEAERDRLRAVVEADDGPVAKTMEYLGQVEAERDHERGLRQGLDRLANTLFEERDEARAERDRLRAVVEALAPFTDHAEDCAVEVDYPCNCGLDRIHAQLDGSAEATDG